MAIKLFLPEEGRNPAAEPGYYHIGRKIVRYVICTAILFQKAGDGGDVIFHGFANPEPVGAPQGPLS
jgi:hypothetical protein